MFKDSSLPKDYFTHDSPTTKSYTVRLSFTRPQPSVNDFAMLAGTANSLFTHYDYSDGNKAAHERGLELAASLELSRSSRCRREGLLGKLSGRSQQISAGLYRQAVSNIGLDPEDRWIAHSRSNAETATHFLRPTHSNSLPHTSDEDAGHKPLPDEPTLLRKGSGELVPSSMKPSSENRHGSMTGTLVAPKSVHFDHLNNRTQHFFQADKTITVVTDSSLLYPLLSEAASLSEVESRTTHGIRLTNPTHDGAWHEHKQVHVEHLLLSPDGSTLVGTVAVQNVSFQKLVIVRFTLDDWKTTSETVAIYTKNSGTLLSHSCDRFIFNIDLSDVASIGKKVLQLCVRYSVDGRDYWDNNNSMNYHIEFATTGKDSTTSKSQVYLSATSLCYLA
jgi:hypothetical protein